MCVAGKLIKQQGFMYVVVPEYGADNEENPDGIRPSRYELVGLLRTHKHSAGAIEFIADMLEV